MELNKNGFYKKREKERAKQVTSKQTENQKGWQNSSTDEGTCYQAQWPEFTFQNLHGGRKNQLPPYRWCNMRECVDVHI